MATNLRAVPVPLQESVVSENGIISPAWANFFNRAYLLLVTDPIEDIAAGMAYKPLVVNSTEDSHVHGQALDRVQLIDATGSSSVTLDGEDYSTFFIYDMDQNLTIDVDLVDGRKIDLYLYRPGAYTITWDFATTTTYAPNGTITIPSPAAIGKYTIFQPNSYYTFVDYVIAFQSV